MALVCGIECTLFYDEDQLENNILSRMNEDCKIEWFKQRTEMVFLRPLKKLFDKDSTVYKTLNEEGCNFSMPAFSIMLNGLESLGAFVPKQIGIIRKAKKRISPNYEHFVSFFKLYMNEWDKTIDGTNCDTDYIPEMLWDNFRNTMAHDFVIICGGIAFEINPKRYSVINNRLMIEPKLFFDDLESAIVLFFNDIKDPSKFRSRFSKEFNNAYPN